MGRCGPASSPGSLLAAVSPLLGPLFTDDPPVHDRLVAVLLVAALGQPIAGVVFVLDGVLIGAGDGRYLAWGGVVDARRLRPGRALRRRSLGGGLLGVWVAFAAVFMGARFVVLLPARAARRLAGDRESPTAPERPLQ